jgi:hypothetical protein
MEPASEIRVVGDFQPRTLRLRPWGLLSKFMFTRSLFPIPALVCILLTLAATTISRASVLILSNGDRLTGHVVKRVDGKVYFHSDILGDIVAPENAVTIVEKPPASVPVNALVGLPPQKQAAPAGSSTTTVLPSPTASTLPPPTVTQAPPVVAQTPAPPPATPAQPAAAGPPVPPPVVKVAAKRSKTPVVLTPPVTPWAGKVEFGYDNIVSSDVRTVALNFSAEAERTIREENYLFKGRFLYGSSSGIATTDEEDGDFRWRHNLSDRLFVQSETTYESDKINFIHYQFEQNEGLGYKIFQSTRQTVDVGAGVTGEELDATGVEKGFTYLGNVFQDYVYKISGRYTLLEDLSAQYSPESRGLSGVVPDTVTPAMGNERDYAYKFHTTLQGKISNHLSLNLHFEYQYDNAVIVPSTRAEQRVTTTLGYGF